MANRIEDLNEIENEPTFLKTLGFKKVEQDTTEPLRTVWYHAKFQSDKSQIRLIIRIEFEVYITDDPLIDNEPSYSFNGVYLIVVNRQMEEENNIYFDEQTEKPLTVGSLRLNISTTSELLSLCKMLDINLTQNKRRKPLNGHNNT